MAKRKGRTLRLAKLKLTKVATEETKDSTKIEIPDVNGKGKLEYFVVPAFSSTLQYTPAIGRGRRSVVRSNTDIPANERPGFNLFPLALDTVRVPWAEATLYLLHRLLNDLTSDMSTLYGIAGDLAAYRGFLDEQSIDWLHFPSQRPTRPTYRYNAELKLLVRTNEIEHDTAKRRMGSIVGFYRWVINEGFEPAHPPWRSQDKYVEIDDKAGGKKTMKVPSTDLHEMPGKKAKDENYIDDGGKLRPLLEEEMQWILEGLRATANTEMKLIFIFAYLTGGRLQSLLTFQVQHVTRDASLTEPDEVRIPIGPWTEIDTKQDVDGITLHIPRWFYERLRTYALSVRARERRMKAVGGDNPNQYLFLSQRGAPLYLNKEDSATFNEENRKTYKIVGQAVRTYLRTKLLPYIREKYNVPGYKFNFHDLRATFGMVLTDFYQPLIAAGKIKSSVAKNNVKVRMGHSSYEITERYFTYREQLENAHAIEEEHVAHLRSMAEPFV